MNQNVNPNDFVPNGIAMNRNIAQCYTAVKRTLERNPLLPGISAFYGPSGFGKSTAANYVATKTNAFYVQVKSTYTKKAFLQALLREMSIPYPVTLSEMMELASSELAKSGRPLIIDEFDHLVQGNKVEIVRDLYEASQGTFLIIGEEMLARKLEKWERFHGRILNWVPALPADISDAKLLCSIYAPMLEIDEPVLEQLVSQVRGSTRRVSTNLEMLNEKALEEGVKHISLKTLKSLLPDGFVTGESPKPRSF
ncbi:AAA family ATPase [Acinetobacter sp. YH01022]|uniref:AAA family ATPase n=1 Tax=Acinetobacter sp. YH01022 TaxID=2601036 RepID=UPI0015D22B19|nr:AAA family ATPase [Acinetobacter sp. YH01022]